MTIMFYPKSDQINRLSELSLTKDVAAVTVFGMQAISTRAFYSDKDTWMKLIFLAKNILLFNCSAGAKFTALIEQGNFQPSWRSVPVGYFGYLGTHVECINLHSVCFTVAAFANTCISLLCASTFVYFTLPFFCSVKPSIRSGLRLAICEDRPWCRV